LRIAKKKKVMKKNNATNEMKRKFSKRNKSQIRKMMKGKK